ncbi:MAG: hypothetical protein ACX930_15050 [Erythrobacter sp.]
MIPILPEPTATPASPTARIAPQLLAGTASFPALLDQTELMRPSRDSREEAPDAPVEQSFISAGIIVPEARGIALPGKSVPTTGKDLPGDLPHHEPAKLARPDTALSGQDPSGSPAQRAGTSPPDLLLTDRQGALVSLAGSHVPEQSATPSRLGLATGPKANAWSSPATGTGAAADSPAAMVEPQSLRPSARAATGKLESSAVPPLKPAKTDGSPISLASEKHALAPISQPSLPTRSESPGSREPLPSSARPDAASLPGPDLTVQRPLPAASRREMFARLAPIEPQPLERRIVNHLAPRLQVGEAVLNELDLPAPPARLMPTAPAPSASPLPTVTADAPPAQSMAPPMAGPSSSVPIMTEARPEIRIASQIDNAIEQLAEAREAGRAARPEMTVRHSEFGAINMRIEAAGADLRATLSARDPGFVPAIQAALAERGVGPATDANASQSQRGHEQGPGHQSSQGSSTGHGQQSDPRYGSSTGSDHASSQPYLEQTASDDEETAMPRQSFDGQTGQDDARRSGLFA